MIAAEPRGGLVIVEPDESGHHLAYLRVVAQHAVAGGYAVAVHLPARDPRMRANSGEEILGELSHEVTITRGAVGPNNWSVGVLILRLLLARETVRVVVLDSDRWLFGIALAQLIAARRGRLRILLMRPVRQSGTRLAGLRFRIKRGLAVLVGGIAGPGSLAILTALGTEWADAWPLGTVQLKEPILVAPSGHSQRTAREVFDIASHHVVIGLLGVQSARKNPGVALQACSLLVGFLNRPVTLLCVGPLSDSSHVVLDSAEVSIIKRFGFVSDGELSAAMSACDAVLCLYDNEGSSGIVSLAASHGIPVVAAGAEGVKTMVERLGIGMSCALDANSVAISLSQLVVGSENASPNDSGAPHDDDVRLCLERWALGSLGQGHGQFEGRRG